MIALLHNIRSLHNVGSIFRTADAAGMEKLYLCGITPTPVDVFGKIRPQAAKVSLGAEKTVLWEKVRSTSKLIKKLKSEGCKILAVEQDKRAIPYYKYNHLTPTLSPKGGEGVMGEVEIAFIVGNEVKGLPRPILKLADKILEIPMRGTKESLNVSVTFGIVAFYFVSLSQHMHQK